MDKQVPLQMVKDFLSVSNVEKMSEAVDDLLIQYAKTIDELKQKGGGLKFEYDKVLKDAKELGLDAEPLMKESAKAIGKLKMYKLI
jgi:hypothetical protein